MNEIFERYLKVSQSWDNIKIDSREFNFFHLINDIYGIGETKHSRFLAFILNPKSSHGQNRLFLDLFLRKLGLEYFENKHWEVYAEKGSADILIQSLDKKHSVVIENKSNDAVDQEHQLFRYWNTHIYQFLQNKESALDKKTNAIVYLTSGYWDKKYSENSVEPTEDAIFIEKYADFKNKFEEFITNWTFYTEIKEWLNKCIEECESERMRFFISDYLQFWDNTNSRKEYFMDKLGEILKDKETFVKATEFFEDVNSVKANWYKKFHDDLNNIIGNNKNFVFDSDKWKDFRWYLKDGKWGDVSFLYEPHKSPPLSIWKRDFFDNWESFKERAKIFEEYGFKFNPNYSNYFMEYPLERLDLNENELAWKFGNDNQDILDKLSEILKPMMDDIRVVEFFKEVDKTP